LFLIEERIFLFVKPMYCKSRIVFNLYFPYLNWL
jgi:hypothetical protein